MSKRPCSHRRLVLRAAVARRDGQTCRGCGIYLHLGGGEGLQLDHIKPISRGGGNKIANLQLLCPRCNLEKADSINWQPKLVSL